MIRLGIFLSFAYLQVNFLAGQAPKPKLDNEKLANVFQKSLEEAYEKSQFPGGSATIVLPDGSTIDAVVGFAEKESKTKIKASDRMMSASIGKTYFAAMAVEMILKKKIALEDKVSKHLGDRDWFEKIPNYQDITIAHLMRHQSGIPRYVFNPQVWKDAIADPDLEWKPGDQLKYIYDRKPVHAAGDGWAYSDTNYILLGLILEKVANTSAYDYVANQLLKPNKLANTIPNDRRELKGLIQGYDVVFRRLGMPEKVIQDGKFAINPQMEWCGGGFLCTPNDLAKWAHVYFSGNAFEGDYVKLLTDDAADSSSMLGANSRYGLGVIIRQTKNGTLLGHDGGFPGYSSTMGYYPEHKIAAAFMYNTDDPRALKQPAFAVMDQLVSKVIEAMKN